MTSLPQQEEIIEDIIIEYVPTAISKDPTLLIFLGAIITIIFGVLFARLMQLKLQGWEREKIPTLPLGNLKTRFSWAGAFAGITLFFSGWLQLLDFAPIKSLISTFTIALISGILMWGTIKDLLYQVDSGEIKEFDEYF